MLNEYNYAQINFYESTAFNLYNYIGHAAFSLFFMINVLKLSRMADSKKVESN